MMQPPEPFWLLQMDTEAVVSVGGIIGAMGLAIAAQYRDARAQHALTVSLMRELNAHLEQQNTLMARRLGEQEPVDGAA